MPELPDVLLYLHALAPRVVDQPIEAARLLSPFVLRTVEPPFDDIVGRRVTGLERIGKRIVLALEGDRFVVIHLMIAGRLRWVARELKPPGRMSLAALDFPGGTLVLTEAGTKRRASMHLLAGRAGLEEFARGGLNLFHATAADFARTLTRENHTLKRALTDPTILDGIGNAYSDEILHAARLGPLVLTSRLTPEELARLFAACRTTLDTWIERLQREAGDAWPDKVTAFRQGMAVHGRFGLPCPACGTAVQRIRYADNETNYCPTCQTGGRLHADRGLSRLLKGDWPRSLAELEERKRHPDHQSDAPPP
jgi:formamidopyrimidine-DNA glycosylase